MVRPPETVEITGNARIRMSGHNKVAIITGAGSGVGRAVAIAFLKDGYRTVLAGRRVDALEETIKLSGAPAAQALAVSTDVTDQASVKNLFARTKETFGRLDVLFNNAGVNAPGGILLEDLSLEQWQAVVDTNLTGPFLCTQEAFKQMKDQSPRGGRIINNGSIKVEAVMDVAHVASTVLHMASLPIEANVLFVTVMATKAPLVGRG